MQSLGKPAIFGVVAVVLIAAYLFFQVDWEARAIRGQFDDLTELVEKDGAVSTLEAAMRSRKLANFFVDEPSLEYYPNRKLPSDIDALSGAFISVWKQVEKVSVRVLRHQVFVDGRRAESQVMAQCSVRFDGAEQMGDTMKYRIEWVRGEENWLIDMIQCIEASR